MRSLAGHLPGAWAQPPQYGIPEAIKKTGAALHQGGTGYLCGLVAQACHGQA